MNPPSEEHAFAQYIRILGKGKTGTRSLEQHEARHAFGMILRGEVEDIQLGAFLMLLRVKEESAGEIAGFVEACRDAMLGPPGTLQADLDWSSYAGKKHQHPWFILSQLLLADAGYRVFIHGSAGHTPGRLYTETAMRALGLPVATSWDEVATALDDFRICYLPLGQFLQPLENMMLLRPLLGLRSPVNTLARLINPLAAGASIQSIFHPAYATIHQQADKLLGQPRALVFKGDSGEIELKPQADTRLHYLQGSESTELSAARTLSGRAQRVDQPQVQPLQALWRGENEDPYGLEALLGTTAAALMLLQPQLSLSEARRQAQDLWQQRDTSRLN